MQLVSNHECQNKPQVTTVCFKANVEYVIGRVTFYSVHDWRNSWQSSTIHKEVTITHTKKTPTAEKPELFCGCS